MNFIIFILKPLLQNQINTNVQRVCLRPFDIHDTTYNNIGSNLYTNSLIYSQNVIIAIWQHLEEDIAIPEFCF